MAKKDIIYYSSGNLVVSLVPFILTPFLINNLSPSEYGRVALFQITLGIFNILVGLSTNGALVRANYNSEISRPKIYEYFFNANLIVLFSSLTLGFFVFIFQSYIYKATSIDVELLSISLFTSMMFYFIRVRLGQWQVNFESFKYIRLQVIQTTLLIFIFFFVFYYINNSSESRIYSHVLALIIVFIISFFSLLREGFYSQCKINYNYIKELLNQGVGILPHLIGIYILSFSDRIIVNKYLGDDSVGVLMLAIQVSLVLNIVVDGINKALNPKLFRILKKDNIEDKIKVVKFTWLLCASSVLLSLPLSYISYQAIIYISPQEYHEAADLVRFIIITQVINGLYVGFVNYILYSKKLWMLSSISIITGLVGIISLTIVSLIDKYLLLAPVISGLYVH
ncbi:oligosaccharide flippase family protein [Vibrio cyclitrophicus]|uniref:Oligosaccharide flippase family protein n=1 Tax=Vibrio cyclitrophicus TaxID=47951 RepID=A0ACD5FX19_9VIBR